MLSRNIGMYGLHRVIVEARRVRRPLVKSLKAAFAPKTCSLL